MNEKKIIIFPGSFDPITKGHESVVLRALPLFDEIIVAIGENAQKKSMFPLEQRINWIKKTFEKYPTVKVECFDCLTVDYCHKRGAKYILRGLRNAVDYEYERNIALVNNDLRPEIETVFLLTKPEHASFNSSFVREIVKYGHDVSKFIPDAISIKNEK